MVPRPLVCAAAIVAICCSEAPAQLPATKLINRGQACLEPYGGAPPSWLGEVDPLRVSFVPGRPIYVTILLPTCLSSCTTGTATCDVTVSGKVIRIASEGQLTDTGAGSDAGFPGQRMCNLACFGLSARCQSVPLPPGRYEVRYGNETHVLDVPSPPVTERLCLGRRE